MADISIATLMMAIQAVRKEICQLETLLQSTDTADGADVQDLLLTYESARDELKTQYVEKQKFASNFPPYESL